MAVTINTRYPRHPGTYQSSESMTQSTATAFQSLNANVDVSFLGMGTATGDNSNNLYSLTVTTTASGYEGDAVEGFEKMIMATATGEAAVFIEQLSGRMSAEGSLLAISTATSVDAMWASATGNWVFSSANDYLIARVWNGAWRVVGGVGPTMATAT